MSLDAVSGVQECSKIRFWLGLCRRLLRMLYVCNTIMFSALEASYKNAVYTLCPEKSNPLDIVQ